ncbi:MAG: hypothetical protein IT531_14405 [Burkholderiales bacterium]|nr:hypothetical protein [Burkholderiales bacterium]
MSNGKSHLGFNVEDKLNELDLTPSQRAQAVGAMKVAEDVVEIVEALAQAVKRIAAVVSLKPSIRA